MMNRILLGNIICMAGSVIMVLTGLIKSNKKVLLTQCGQYGLLAIGNLVLGGISGFISDLISVARNLFSLKFQIKWHTKILFIVIQIILTAIYNQAGFIGWLPTLATCIFTWCIDTKSEVLMKLLIIFAQTMWGIYDISIKNYGTLIFDLMTIITSIISIIKIKLNRS